MVLSVEHTGRGREQMSLSKKDILQGMVVLHGRGSPYRTQTIIERAASFLVDLSRCCGQSLHSDSQSYLEGLVRSILEESERGSDKEKTFLKQWAMESSLLSAKICDTRRSRTFLDDVEATMTQHKPLNVQSTGTASYHVHAPSTEPVLRWEEGLCEWIVASPLRTKKSNKVASRDRSTSRSEQDSDLDDSGYLSEVKETPTLQRKGVNMSNMLASPDVLGFDLEMLACPSLNDMAGVYKTAIESWKASSTTQASQPSTLQKRTLNTVKAVAKLSKTETHTVLSDEKFDIAERPAKKRNNQAMRESTPETSHTTLAGPREFPKQELQDRVKEQEPEASESDKDELAMSCSKPRGRASLTKKVVSRKSRVKTSLPAKRAGSQFVDISDDELGF
jgi:hypothetical protein